MMVKKFPHLAEMKEVRSPVPAGNQDIVQIDEHEGQALKYSVRHKLEFLRSIPETKGHLEKLLVAKRGDDGGLGYVGG